MEILLILLFVSIFFIVVLSFAQRAEPLKAGELAPQFQLPDLANRAISLPAQGKPLVLAFFPRDRTARCGTQLREFSEASAEFAALGWDVAFVAVGSVAENVRYAADMQTYMQTSLTLLSDADGRISKKYGSIIDFWVYRFAKRTTFLIDAKGKITECMVVTEPAGHCAAVLKKIRAG
jgi:thioredoxin-dependent peroxiredoxin